MSLFYGYESKHESLKSDVTGKLSTTGGDMTGDINMGSNHIITSVDPTKREHLARKKYVDDLVRRHTDVDYLSRRGGTMRGNIDMGPNKISTTANPASDKDLCRKKYVDDQDSRKLSVTGGTMSGNIVMGNNKIETTSDPIGEKHLARKKYIDNQDSKKLSLTGGTLTGDVTIGSNKIISSTDPTLETHLARKKYVDVNLNNLKKDVSFSILKDNFSLKFHNLFFIEYDSAYDLLFERNGGKVKELIDYGFEGNNFKQTTKSLQPSLCTESEKENNKYHLKFKDNRMITDSNLNPVSRKKDIFNVFIVYKLKSYYGSTWLKSGLFGNDNNGWDKLIAFANNGDLITSGDTNNFNVIGTGSYLGNNPIAAYKTKANAETLNKWCSLSVYWDNYTTPAGNNSSVYCNGKKLADFQSKVTSGSTKTALGDISINKKISLDGDIAFFGILKYKKMTEKEILFYHYVLCNLYNVEHDAISI